jgi:hypothetical protein
MPPKLTREEFDLMAARTGLPIAADERAALYEVVLLIEAMKERVRTPRVREAEPAVIFVPGAPQ